MPLADDPPRHIDARIEALRQAALRFGSEMNMLERATCGHDGCTLPGCPDAAMETVTLRRLLEVLADEWDPDDLPEDPGIGPMELRRIQRFRQALLEFGAALGLFACDCGEEVCPKRNPHALTTLDLLAVVRGEWHARAGCLFRCQHSVPAERVARVEGVLERNRARLPALREQLAAASPADWDAAAHAAATAAATPLYREARAAADHALEVWVRQGTPGLDAVQHALRQGPAARGWGDEEAAAFLRAAAAAVDALQLRDVVAPEMFVALYAPLEPLAPFADLDAAPASAGPSRWTGLN
jgi:hypothetical protein